MLEEFIIPLMIFLILCVVGLTIMLYYIMSTVEQLCRAMKTERSDMLDQLQRIEGKLEMLVALGRRVVPSKDDAEPKKQHAPQTTPEEKAKLEREMIAEIAMPDASKQAGQAEKFENPETAEDAVYDLTEQVVSEGK